MESLGSSGFQEVSDLGVEGLGPEVRLQGSILGFLKGICKGFCKGLGFRV